MEKHKKKILAACFCVGVAFWILNSLHKDKNYPSIKKIASIDLMPELIKFSSDYRKVAFSPNQIYFCEGAERSFQKRKNIYVFDIETQELIQIIDNSSIFGLAWQKSSGGDILLFSKMETVFGFCPIYFLYWVNFHGTNNFPQIEKSFFRPDIVSSFSWSPDGRNLIGKPRKDYSASKNSLRGNLAASLDQGRNAFYYQGINFRDIFWIDNQTFYTQNDAADICKFKIEHGILKRIEEIENEKQKNTQLVGVASEKPVLCVEGHQLYLGKKEIYKTENLIQYAHVSSPYIAFRENNELITLDISGETINKKYLNDDFVVLDIDGERKNTYILFQQKIIAQWGFNKNELVHVFDFKKY